MTNQDTITLTELENIATKIDNMERPLDFDHSDIGLTERENRIVKAMGSINRMGLHNEFKRLNNKIMNHHHVTLGVVDGINFRNNGSVIHSERSVFENEKLNG